MIDLLPQIHKFSKNNPYLDFVDNNEPFMPKFYEQVNDIRTDLFNLDQMILTLQNLQYNICEIRNDKTNLFHNDIDNLSHKIYCKLEGIKMYNNSKQVDTINRIILNIHTALSMTFSTLRQRYNTIKNQYDERTRKFFPDYDHNIPPNKMEQLELLTSNKLDVVNDAYNYIFYRHKDIMKLEKDIQEISQLFLDVASIVDNQGETVDRIAYKVSTAKNYCKEANEDFTEAYKVKKGKKVCIIQ
jgi:t-SNARE complex subunit (syntaxin)